ncbi:MAG: TIGR00730 family Rossman fold protein [Acidobacteriota bacterium]
MLRSVCVFCGSSFGRRQAYADAAVEVGRLLAQRQITLIYGGGNVGLMGVAADACLAAGGRVIGVIPQSMVEREIAHLALTDLRIVRSMHERKALMAELSDGFIALPGGFGTFEELFEILTWRQIRIHDKPLGLLNVQGYFDPLLALADHAVEEGFLRAGHRSNLLAGTDAADLLAELDGCAKPVTAWESPL